MIPTMILSTAVIVLLVMLFFVLTMEFKKLNKRLNKIEVSMDFVQNDVKTRNAEYKARKDWRTFREKNLPRQNEGPRIPRSPMSKDEMTRKADQLEQELQR